MRALRVLILLLGATPAVAQTETRLDPAVAAFVAEAVARAEAEGLPGAPLRSKALEGASKGADAAAIRRAVERLAERLRNAQAALGSATDAELVAAAALLDLGVPERTLTTLRAERPDRPIAGALVGHAFLVQRGVPVERSTELVRAMLAASVTERDFAQFQRLVEQDVLAGAPVHGAAQARARAFIEHGGRIRMQPDGGVR